MKQLFPNGFDLGDRRIHGKFLASCSQCPRTIHLPIGHAALGEMEDIPRVFVAETLWNETIYCCSDNFVCFAAEHFLGGSVE